MFLLLPFIVLGIAVGLARGGALSKLAQMPLRYGWLIILAFALQVIIFLPWFESLPFSADAVPGLYMATMLVLVVAIGLNLAIPAMRVVMLGLLLNSIVIVANGGFQPVPVEVVTRLGKADKIGGMRATGHYSNWTLATPDTRLTFLGDVLVIPTLVMRENAFSVGDLILSLGILLLVEEGMVASRPRGATFDS